MSTIKQIEQEVTWRLRKGQLQEIILNSVKIAGFLSIALLAPNALSTFKKLGITANPRQKEIIANTRKSLVRDGLLIYTDGKLTLTEKGRNKLEKITQQNNIIQKPKKWDGKWRVLIFDIPNKRKGLRDKVRHSLIDVGFCKIQQSVWVYPYPCDDFITLLKADFKVGKDLLYMVVESIEYDQTLRSCFNLTKK
ncbi:hypothetical protein EPO17_02940 [Patescibacteria group bacterium]|nr:MAG: hypothetical protein EPO17_02940 [Patescibacteria group bacterium]